MPDPPLGGTRRSRSRRRRRVLERLYAEFTTLAYRAIHIHTRTHTHTYTHTHIL